MTKLELLAFVIAPLLMLGTGGAVYLLTGWLDRRESRRTGAR